MKMLASQFFRRRQILHLGGAGAIGFFGGGIIMSEIFHSHGTSSVKQPDGYLMQDISPYLHPGTFNQQFLAKTADIKQIWDFSNIEQIQSDGFNAIRNTLNELKFLYQKSLYVLIDLRGQAIIYGLDDILWEKYKLNIFLGQNSDQSISYNPYYKRITTGDENSNPNDINSLYQDSRLQALQQRGVHIVVCHQALKALSLKLAGQHDSTTQSVFEELSTHLIPGVQQTPSGSSLLAVAQYLGFTYAKQ